MSCAKLVSDKVCFLSGYLPFIVYLGNEQSNKSVIVATFIADKSTGYTYSEPKPTLFKYLSRRLI